MVVFTSTISQMAFLLILLGIGFLLVRLNLIPHSCAGALSKLESYIFIPASVLGTFMSEFTVKKLTEAGGFFLAGGVIIQTRESTMEVRSGDLLIARRSPLVMRTPPGGMAQKYCLLLSNTMIQSAICDLWGHNDPCVLHPAEPEKIGSALEKIAEYVKKGDSRKQLELLIFAFLQEVCRQHRQREKIPELLEKAQSILKKEDYRLSRAELADRCQVSPRTLTRIFARCLNCSPGQYIIKCRLEKAARMLSFSSAPVKTIAAECGFSSPMFFAREFRQHYHCTPTAFRRRENKK